MIPQWFKRVTKK